MNDSDVWSGVVDRYANRGQVRTLAGGAVIVPPGAREAKPRKTNATLTGSEKQVAWAKAIRRDELRSGPFQRIFRV